MAKSVLKIQTRTPILHNIKLKNALLTGFYTLLMALGRTFRFILQFLLLFFLIFAAVLQPFYRDKAEYLVFLGLEFGLLD